MQFGILGPLRVVDGGAAINLGRPKQRAVLAVLLIEANRVVSVDRLVDLLWGDLPPPTATTALQVYVSQLRRILEPDRAAGESPRVLLTRSPGYELRIEPADLDAARFEAMVVGGRRDRAEGRWAAVRSTLEEAIGLWRGTALADFAFDQFAQPEVARLEELRAVALEDRLEADLALGNHSVAVSELEVLVREHPLRERLWGLLMLARYRAGRQAEALRAFTEVRERLAEELGIDPGPALRQLEADILAQSPTLEWRPPTDARRGVTPNAGPVAAVPARLELRSPLIGRETALTELESALGDACAGHGRIVLVSGEAGIGKTRLATELAARAAARRMAVAWGACYEGEGAPAFWPWVQALRGLVAVVDKEEMREALLPCAGEIAQVFPQVKELVGDIDPPAIVDPGTARFRLSEAVTSLLVRVASGRGLVVVLDDVQWADPASLQLAQFLANQVRTASVLLVLNFRDGEIGPPLTDTLAALARNPSLDRIGLEGLTPEEVGRFLGDPSGGATPSALAAALHARTEGNPFFVTEIVRLIASDASFARDQADTVGRQVPVAVRDVIRARLAHLAAPSRRLLLAASVVGRDFDLRVVAAAIGADIGAALEQIEGARATGMVSEDAHSTGGYRFSHALVQETVYGELTAVRRADLHARVAEALATVGGEEGAALVPLAHHWCKAARVVGTARGIDFCLRASQWAQGRLAFEQAGDLLRRALELLATERPSQERARQELEVQHRLAALLATVGGYTARGAEEARARAWQLCLELEDSEQMLGVLSGMTFATLVRADLSRAHELATMLLIVGNSRGEPGFLLAGHLHAGLVACRRGRLANAKEHLAEAIIRAESLGTARWTDEVIDPVVLARGYLGISCYLIGDEGPGRALAAEAVREARRERHPFSLVAALVHSAILDFFRGDVAAVLATSEEARAEATKTGMPFLRTLAEANCAWAGALAGRADAISDLTRCLADLPADGFTLGRPQLLQQLAEAHFAVGAREAGMTALDHALEVAEATGERWSESSLCRLRGEMLHTRWPARRDEAECWLQRAVDVATGQGALALVQQAHASLERLPR